MKRNRSRFTLTLTSFLVLVVAFGIAVDRLTGSGWDSARAVETMSSEQRHRAFARVFRDGVRALDNGDVAALPLFQQAVALRPDIAEAHVNLGYASLDASMPVGARAAFERALEIRPQQINAYFGLAESAEALGDLETAVGAMRTYLHLTEQSDPFRRRAMAAVWEWEWRLQNAIPATGEKHEASEQKASNSGPAIGAKLTALAALPRVTADGKLPEGRIVIANFWATWCAPCRRELPELQDLADRLDGKKAVVVGIAVDAEAEFVREFMNDLGVSFLNLHDSKGVLARAEFGVASYPQTLIFDKDGTLHARIEGAVTGDGHSAVTRAEVLLTALLTGELADVTDGVDDEKN